MKELKEHKLNYFYDEQMRHLLVQFLTVFTCIKVKSGKTNEVSDRFIGVNVKNGSSDRVVAAIKSDNTQNKPLRLPLIAGTLVNLNLDPSLRKGTRTERRQTVMEVGESFPQGIKTIKQNMPVPYMANFELNIFTTSQEQHYEILEQILILFDPTLEIQTSDEVMDWTRLHKLELTGISFDESVAGNDRRIIQTTLTFDSPLYLSAPTIVTENYIAEIKLRVTAICQELNGIENSLGEINEQNPDGGIIVRTIKDFDF